MKKISTRLVNILSQADSRFTLDFSILQGTAFLKAETTSKSDNNSKNCLSKWSVVTRHCLILLPTAGLCPGNNGKQLKPFHVGVGF